MITVYLAAAAALALVCILILIRRKYFPRVVAPKGQRNSILAIAPKHSGQKKWQYTKILRRKNKLYIVPIPGISVDEIAKSLPKIYPFLVHLKAYRPDSWWDRRILGIHSVHEVSFLETSKLKLPKHGISKGRQLLLGETASKEDFWLELDVGGVLVVGGSGSGKSNLLEIFRQGAAQNQQVILHCDVCLEPSPRFCSVDVVENYLEDFVSLLTKKSEAVSYTHLRAHET
jgi:hypothetical protein